MNNQTKSTLQVAIETLILSKSKHPIEKFLNGSTLDNYLIYINEQKRRDVVMTLLARKHMSDEELKEVYREDRAKRVFILLNKKELLDNNFTLTEDEIKIYSDYKNNFDFTDFLISNNIENSSSAPFDVRMKMINDFLQARTENRLDLLLNPDDENDDSIKEIKY